MTHAELEDDSQETADEQLVLAEGESLTYDPTLQEILWQKLTPEDFESLLQSPLMVDFAEEIPGLGDLEDAFGRLFPDIPFPGVAIPRPDLPSGFPGLPF